MSARLDAAIATYVAACTAARAANAVALPADAWLIDVQAARQRADDARRLMDKAGRDVLRAVRIDAFGIRPRIR